MEPRRVSEEPQCKPCFLCAAAPAKRGSRKHNKIGTLCKRKRKGRQNNQQHTNRIHRIRRTTYAILQAQETNWPHRKEHLFISYDSTQAPWLSMPRRCASAAASYGRQHGCRPPREHRLPRAWKAFRTHELRMSHHYFGRARRALQTRHHHFGRTRNALKARWNISENPQPRESIVPRTGPTYRVRPKNKTCHKTLCDSNRAPWLSVSRRGAPAEGLWLCREPYAAPCQNRLRTFWIQEQRARPARHLQLRRKCVVYANKSIIAPYLNVLEKKLYT